MLTNPKTMYRIELVLNPSTPPEVLDVVRYMTGRKVAWPFTAATVPNHPFFFTPDWMKAFNRATSRSIARRTSGAYVLRLCGESALEEQDIGLFLRWLLPHVRLTHRPRRVAVVRNKARTQLPCLSYFVSEGALTAEFVEQPLLTINNFQARAAA